MSTLEVFKFENQQVRFVGTADDPWWVAADVCAVLKTDTTQTRKLEDDEKGLRLIQTPGGEQKMICINESGLYSLILRSRKPQAKRFKKWVTSEVLPTIRKTGSYSIQPTPQLTLEETIALANFASETAQNAGVSKEVAESIKLDSVMQIAPEAKPLLLPQKNAIASAKPVKEQAVTPTVIGQRVAKRLGVSKVSSRSVNKKLLQLGYQVSVTKIKKSTGKEVHDYYKPTQKTIDGNYGQLEMSTYKDGEGKNTKYQLRWWNEIVDVLVNNWEEQ